MHESVELDPDEREMTRAEVATLATWVGVDVSGAGAGEERPQERRSDVES